MICKEDLIEIYTENLDILNEGYYKTSDGEIPLQGVNQLEGNQNWYDTTPSIPSDIERPYTTKVYVQNIDTFLKAKEMGSNSVVLNMASERCPGGGVVTGSRAQEEELCRRSNLLYGLYAFSNWSFPDYDLKGIHEYPIPIFGGIYTPNVCVFRDNNYNLLSDPYMTNVISVAGLRRPELITIEGEYIITPKMAKVLKKKIETILSIAIINKHTKIVLGALGCGAFHNPPAHVAQIFKDVISEYDGYFEEICFAILDDGNTGKFWNPEGNYKPFVDVFGEK